MSLEPSRRPLADRSNRFFWLAIAVITILAAGWRAWRIETPSFDNDEVWQIVHCETDLAKQWYRHDNFPPLYHWVVSLVFAVAKTDQAARWFSLACGVATIPLVGLLGRRLGGAAAGIAAAGLLAVSANHVLMSQLGRAYAPLILLATVTMLLAWRLREHDSWRDWAAFIVAAWTLVATHYFGGVLLIVLGVLLLAEKGGKALGRVIAAAVILAIAGLPLVGSLRADLKDSGEFFHHVGFDAEAYAMGYLWLVTGNTLGPSVTDLREMTSLGQKREAIMAMAPWALLAVAPVAVLLLAAWGKLNRGDRVWIAALVLAPPLVVLAASSVVSTGFTYRYYVWVIVPLTAAMGVGASTMRGRPLATIATGLLIALGIGATLNRHFDAYYYENDFHAVAALIERLDEESLPPAVLGAPLHYGRGALYGLPNDWLKQPVSAHPDAEQDWDEKLPAFAREATPRKTAWLVTQWFPKGHPQRAVCEELVDRLDAELIDRVSSTVMVYRFTINRSTGNQSAGD
jgi:4-amino-4-deoxy-L-arabinose transferase-like glycosyltransferase